MRYPYANTPRTPLPLTSPSPSHTPPPRTFLLRTGSPPVSFPPPHCFPSRTASPPVPLPPPHRFPSHNASPRSSLSLTHQFSSYAPKPRSMTSSTQSVPGTPPPASLALDSPIPETPPSTSRRHSKAAESFLGKRVPPNTTRANISSLRALALFVSSTSGFVEAAFK